MTEEVLLTTLMEVGGLSNPRPLPPLFSLVDQSILRKVRGAVVPPRPYMPGAISLYLSA